MTQATLVNLRGATFSNYFRNAYKFPISTLPDTYYLFGTDSSSVRNLAVDDDSDASAAGGSPTFGTGYANLSQANYVSNGVSAAGQHTLVCIADKASGSGARGYIGNWNPATPKSNLLYHNANIQTHSISGSGRATQTFDQSTSFGFMACTWDGATSTVYAHNGSSLLTSSSAYSGSGGTATPLRVGGISDLAACTFKCAAALRFSSALSSGDVALLYAYLKTLLATRGVTVL